MGLSCVRLSLLRILLNIVGFVVELGKDLGRARDAVESVAKTGT